MNGELAALCERHRTDKRPSYHDYTRIYGPLFAPLRARPDLRVLEIGVSAGASLRVWAAYFPQAQLCAIDHDPETRAAVPTGVRFACADQADREALRAAIAGVGGGPFDLIIDDGGHQMIEQQVSLAALFPVVRPGGLYIVEDVHTSFPRLHPGYGVGPGGANSTYALFDRFARTGVVSSPYITPEEAETLAGSVAWVSYHFRPTRKHSDLMVWAKA